MWIRPIYKLLIVAKPNSEMFTITRKEPTPITAWFKEIMDGSSKKRNRPTQVPLVLKKKKTNEPTIENPDNHRIEFESLPTEYQLSDQMKACVDELLIFKRGGPPALAAPVPVMPLVTAASMSRNFWPDLMRKEQAHISALESQLFSGVAPASFLGKPLDLDDLAAWHLGVWPIDSKLMQALKSYIRDEFKFARGYAPTQTSIGSGMFKDVYYARDYALVMATMQEFFRYNRVGAPKRLFASKVVCPPFCDQHSSDGVTAVRSKLWRKL